MAEFIERDETCENCVHYGVCYHIEHYGRDIETDEPCEKFKLDADVVEVVHGEWKEIDNIVIENGMLTVKGTTWCCNVCGEARKTLTKPNMNYCPNCGADMRGETNDL